MVTRADITLVQSLFDKKGRREHGLFVVEGRKAVGEALASGWTVERVYTTGAATDHPGVPVTEVSPAQFERLSRLKSPQGVLALVRIPEQSTPHFDPGRLYIALDSVQDPGNLGTIIRIADWFGIDGIVCSIDTADRFNPKVVQATMGSLFRVPVRYGDLAGLLQAARDTGLPVYGAMLGGENIYTARLRPSGVIVMGNEGNGISPGIIELLGHRLTIPSFAPAGEGAESLNVAVSAAVIVSEFRRRTGQ